MRRSGSGLQSSAVKLLCVVALLVAAAAAQQPPVRVNVLNVCAPGEAEQKEIAAELARIPQRPAFAADFEVTRGRSSAPDAPASRFVRIRREFNAASPFATVQYSFSVDDKNTVVETLVFRLRQDKDLMQVAIEHAATDTTPAGVLAATPAATRIRLEHFGRGSVVLARCGNANQAAYEPLFSAAADVLGRYRTLLKAQSTVTADLARIGVANRK